MSKYFILDNEESFWQSGIYRKAKRHGMNHAFLKYLVTINAHPRKEMHYYE